MEKIIDRRFLDRNTKKGVERYLSTLGFDLALGYSLQPGPTKKLVKVVENEAPKKVVKKAAKQPVKKSIMKKVVAAVKKAPRSK